MTANIVNSIVNVNIVHVLHVSGRSCSVSWRIAMTRLFGRRLTMITGGAFFLAGATLNGFAQEVWMLIVGHMLLGYGIEQSSFYYLLLLVIIFIKFI